jgi:hypothetical protein
MPANRVAGHRVSRLIVTTSQACEMQLRIPLSLLAGSIKHVKTQAEGAKHWFLVRQISIISRNLFPPRTLFKPYKNRLGHFT